MDREKIHGPNQTNKVVEKIEEELQFIQFNHKHIYWEGNGAADLLYEYRLYMKHGRGLNPYFGKLRGTILNVFHI